MNLRLVSLLCVLGALALVASACGSSTQCGAATCQSGCCTATGQCVASSNASCGTGGATCAMCSADQMCTAGVCRAGTGGGSATGGGSGGGSTGGGSGGGGGGNTQPSNGFMVIRLSSSTDAGLSSTATAIALEERALDTGSLLRTVDVTGSSNPAVTLSGSATSDGVLNRSADKRYVSLACYVAPVGQASVNSTAGVARAVARIDANGAVDSSTRITDAYFVNNIRSAASDDGTGFWLAGASAASLDGGLRYVTLGSSGASTPIYTGVENTRATHISGGILYATTASASDAGITRVFAFSGLPTTGGAIATSMPGISLTGPQGLAVLDLNSAVPGNDVAYVADSASGQGVRKYVFSGTQWSEAAVFNEATPGSVTCLHVAAELQGADVVVLCTTNEGSRNRVLRFVDVGGMATSSPTPTVLATAPTNSVFRGVAFSPR